LASVWSATSYRAEQLYGNSNKFFFDQLIRVSLGLALMVVVAKVDYRTWLGLSPWFYFGSLILLLLLFTPLPFVKVQYGARAWYKIGSMMFQPSDFARYAMILLLARVIHKNREKMDDLIHGYLLNFAFAGVIVVLIVLEHDMGGAVLTLLVALMMFFFAEVSLTYLAATILTLSSLAFTYVLINPYMLKRLTMRAGENYQLKQSLIALAHGGLLGQGAGDSHAKYNFLPMVHNDFIYSLIGEEYGLLGTLGVLVLFILIIQRGIRIAQQAPDGYGRLLAGGITVCIGSYALLNAAVAVGVLPTTGIPMPFLSYGGTAIVAHFIGVGLLLNISSQAHPAYGKSPGWRTYRERLNRPPFQAGSYMLRRLPRTNK